MRAMRPGFSSAVLGASVLLLAATGETSAEQTRDSTSDRIVRFLLDQREQVGSDPLVRRPVLDGVALERARQVAGLPHARRLSLSDSIETGLREAGITRYRRASVHLDMVRGYTDPAAGFLRSWKGYAMAWSKAMDPRFDAVGVATSKADDGWIILVAVFVDDLPVFDDLRDLELSTIRAVNEIRLEHGLPELIELEPLSDVARSHGLDMARRGYFGHRTPEGRQVQDRVLAGGLGFTRLAENLHQSRGWDDPVSRAVRAWMDSPGHREPILDPGYRETGVGVAAADDGTLYFTQLFLQRREERGPPGNGPSPP